MPTKKVKIILTLGLCLAFVAAGVFTAHSLGLFPGEDSPAAPEVSFGADTPNRIGTLGSISVEFKRLITLSDSYTEADIVAEVLITEWLGELEKHVTEDRTTSVNTTLFKAKIIKMHKNNINFEKEEITLLQGGDSECTFKNYPLFKNGDRLLLCLNRSKNYMITKDYADCFIIPGAMMTDLYVIDYNGVDYAVNCNRFDIFTDEFLQNSLKSSGAKEKLFDSDDILKTSAASSSAAYKLEDITDFFATLDK